MNGRGRRAGAALVAVLLTLGTAATPEHATGRPGRIALSALIGAFLVDAGVRTQGLPWTTGSALPVRWETPGPVPNPDAWARQRGLALTRTGSATALLGDTVALEVVVTLSGTDAGLQQVMVHIPSMQVTHADGSGYFVTVQMVEASLKADGMAFQPIKCSRETEGASYGNLVDAVQMPGKMASGLWWLWQSPMQEPNLTLTLLYRRADMQQVECAG